MILVKHIICHLHTLMLREEGILVGSCAPSLGVKRTSTSCGVLVVREGRSPAAVTSKICHCHSFLRWCKLQRL